MKYMKFVDFRIVVISFEMLMCLKVINIEISKMLLFQSLEAKNILHEKLAANSQQRRQQPPLLYNSPLEPLVASNCKGTIKTQEYETPRRKPTFRLTQNMIRSITIEKDTQRKQKLKNQILTTKIDQNVPCVTSKQKSPHQIANTTRISFEKHAESAPPRPET